MKWRRSAWQTVKVHPQHAANDILMHSILVRKCLRCASRLQLSRIKSIHHESGDGDTHTDPDRETGTRRHPITHFCLDSDGLAESLCEKALIFNLWAPSNEWIWKPFKELRHEKGFKVTSLFMWWDGNRPFFVIKAKQQQLWRRERGSVTSLLLVQETVLPNDLLPSYYKKKQRRKSC